MTRTIIGVMGSGTHAHPLSADVGRLIATLGFDLLTGAGGGTMEAVSRGFYETSGRRGLVIGIVPGSVRNLERLESRTASHAACDVQPGYPNQWVEIAIRTHLPDSGPEGTLRSSRNHINVLSSTGIIALAGGEGTYSEMWLATRYGTPIVAFGEHERTPANIPRASTLNELEGFLRTIARGR